MSGCESTDTRDPLEPINDRETAIEESQHIHDTAVRQGVNFKTAPCIFNDPNSEWVIVVDWSGGRPFREVATECPAFEFGDSPHAVILTPEGEVVEAR
jgi:hypothetical protein